MQKILSGHLLQSLGTMFGATSLTSNAPRCSQGHIWCSPVQTFGHFRPLSWFILGQSDPFLYSVQQKVTFCGVSILGKCRLPWSSWIVQILFAAVSGHNILTVAHLVAQYFISQPWPFILLKTQAMKDADINLMKNNFDGSLKQIWATKWPAVAHNSFYEPWSA